MIQPEALANWCSQLLDAGQFDDYCPNGLQVEGLRPISSIVSGVTACEALIDEAIEAGADAILVHHGYFWKGETEVLTGMKAQRIRKLIQHNISLLAYHLPLDAHIQLGNNAQLGQLLGFQQMAPIDDPKGLWWAAETSKPLDAIQMAGQLAQVLGRLPLHIDGGNGLIRKISWCTGGAQGYINEAAALGADAYISGEISEHTFHAARELGIHYFAAGHHATERYGVQALGERIADEFGINHKFIDIDNPV
ncbi:Nif3-like dinuclear metal center hexameric protein [Solemya elarraichensis gill symbiont]|uniref:GTP cyclohydrolase 1 type 2 homolog n=1 Tax=Solemya elarraichensis gill symbiont TaxID=1918949 RepID=A0A1T2LBX6_9GAMM|nr:Nif3-like dinuclear metal center hexameric protein [Solemya elarraichensis gill symbiont]OOZ42609.1 Nif3-like dinuclear metal center hexameric protein [Solemya elarraichensis gill symbiont]